jgi:hypothetical protein
MARFAQSDYQERIVVSYDHPSVTADATYKMWKAPRACYVASVQYINVTGLAEATVNAFAGSILNDATVVATIFDTDSDEAGADNGLAANTFVDGVVVTAAGANVLAAGDVLSLFLDEDAAGAATLPAGRVLVEIVYL